MPGSSNVCAVIRSNSLLPEILETRQEFTRLSDDKKPMARCRSTPTAGLDAIINWS